MVMSNRWEKPRKRSNKTAPKESGRHLLTKAAQLLKEKMLFMRRMGHHQIDEKRAEEMWNQLHPEEGKDETDTM